MSQSDAIVAGICHMCSHAGVALLGVLTGPMVCMAQGVAHSPAEPSCRKCTVVVRPLFELDASASFRNLPKGLATVREDAQRRLWVFHGTDAPRVFNSNGQFIKRFVLSGDLLGSAVPFDGMALPGDSLLLIGADGVASIIDGNLRVARQVSLPALLRPAVVVQWPSVLIMTGLIPTPKSAGWSMHRVSLSASSAEVSGSFGLDDGEWRPGSPPMVTATPAGSDSFWVADLDRYRITLWTVAGVAERIIERVPSWFPRATRAGVGGPNMPPSPHIAGVQQDREGLLWVFISVTGKNWRSAWPKLPDGTVEVPSDQVRWQELFSTIVEIIDPQSSTLMARFKTDDLIWQVLPGQRAVILGLDGQGMPHIRIATMRLVGRGD